MRIPAYLLFTVLFPALISCNNEDTRENAVLSQPPYHTLTDSIHKFPRQADLYFRRGTLLYQNNQLAAAEQDLRTAWQLQPSEPNALRLTTILKQKNTDSALVFLQQATTRLPESISLQIALARAYQQKGQKDKAMAIVDRVIGQYPGQLDAITIKSELLKNENKKEASLAYLERAYALVPSDPQLAYDLAFEYADQKNIKALHLTDSLIKAKAPAIERAYYVRGTYYNHTGNTVEAMKSYDAAIRANYNFLDAYLDKGILFYEQKQYDEALETFGLGLRVDPATAEFYYWSGKTLQAKGQKEDAKLNYQRAYQLDKTFTEAKQAAEAL